MSLAGAKAHTFLTSSPQALTLSKGLALALPLRCLQRGMALSASRKCTCKAPLYRVACHVCESSTASMARYLDLEAGTLASGSAIPSFGLRTQSSPTRRRRRARQLGGLRARDGRVSNAGARRGRDASTAAALLVAQHFAAQQFGPWLRRAPLPLRGPGDVPGVLRPMLDTAAGHGDGCTPSAALGGALRRAASEGGRRGRRLAAGRAPPLPWRQAQ